MSGLPEIPSDHQDRLDQIADLSQEDMCRLHRFAPSGHPYFDGSLCYYEIFKARFDKLGGFTPEISKKIGWDAP